MRDADDQAFLTNIPARVESLLHDLDQAVRAIGLDVIVNKTEFMCFKKEGAMSTNW